MVINYVDNMRQTSAAGQKPKQKNPSKKAAKFVAARFF